MRMINSYTPNIFHFQNKVQHFNQFHSFIAIIPIQLTDDPCKSFVSKKSLPKFYPPDEPFWRSIKYPAPFQNAGFDRLLD